MDTERIIEVTADGSHTLFIPSMNEHYHSVNGAFQESDHVFIRAGLAEMQKKEIRILEIGFGTGLNALLSLRFAENSPVKKIYYSSIERYPLAEEVINKLNYGKSLGEQEEEWFRAIHAAEWNRPVGITKRFVLHKIEADSNQCPLPSEIDLIYFDAFAPDKQPEMWEQSIFDKIHRQATSGAVLVTYCAKGEVRRRIIDAGFKTERLPGPVGKRHMLRGVKMG